MEWYWVVAIAVGSVAVSHCERVGGVYVRVEICDARTADAHVV